MIRTILSRRATSFDDWSSLANSNVKRTGNKSSNFWRAASANDDVARIGLCLYPTTPRRGGLGKQQTSCVVGILAMALT